MKKAMFDTVINETEEISAVVIVYPAEPINNFPRPYVGEVILKDANGDEVDLGEVSDEDMELIEEKALEEVKL